VKSLPLDLPASGKTPRSSGPAFSASQVTALVYYLYQFNVFIFAWQGIDVMSERGGKISQIFFFFCLPD
jgi:hypothetical protein